MTYVAGSAFGGRERELAKEVVDLHYRRSPHLAQNYSDSPPEKCVDDVVFHLLYLHAAVSSASLRIFYDYISWAKIVFSEKKIDHDRLSVLLDVMPEVLNARLGKAEAAIAVDYLRQVRDSFEQMPRTIDFEVREGNRHFALARTYSVLVLNRQRREAAKLILDAAANGLPIREIYLDILQPSLRDVGRLWQTGRVTVAEEHYFTAVTQMIMSQLYPYIFAERRLGKVLVATCVSGELHEIGMRMLADLFELEGWDTHYLGANVPSDGVIEAVVTLDAAILAVSATISAHLPLVRALIDGLRADPRTRSVRILVGGYPFNVDRGLWRELGADGTAPDAVSAIAVADRLVGRSTPA